MCLTSPSVFPLQRTAWFPPSYAGRLWPYRVPWSLTMPAVKVTFPDPVSQPHSLPLSPLASMSFLRHLGERLCSSHSWNCPPGALVALYRWHLRGPLLECFQFHLHDTVLPHFLLCFVCWLSPLLGRWALLGQNSVHFVHCCVLSYQHFIGTRVSHSLHHSTNMKGITNIINICYERMEPIPLALTESGFVLTW